MKTLTYFAIASTAIIASWGCGISCSAPSRTVAAPLTVVSPSTSAGIWLIEYHIDGDKLSYAVITGPCQGEVEGHARAGGSTDGETHADLRRPDGTTIPILGTGRIFYISGTNISEATHPMSASEFRAFLDSSPSDYSLSALDKFAQLQKR